MNTVKEKKTALLLQVTNIFASFKNLRTNVNAEFTMNTCTGLMTSTTLHVLLL